jgi:hypothetical protein
MFDKLPKYHTKILLGDFNAIISREDIFKLKIGNESLHEISSDNGVTVVNFETSKNLTVRNTKCTESHKVEDRADVKQVRDIVAVAAAGWDSVVLIKEQLNDQYIGPIL